MAEADVRLTWKLPLLGSAEMNRIQPIRAGRFTSRLYPVLSEDALSAATPTLDKYFGPAFADGAQIFAVMGGGTLTSGYQLLTLEEERASWAGGALSGGTLVVTTKYSTYSMDEEQASFMGGALAGGTLVVTTNYITYTMATEDVRFQGGQLVGGTLA